MPHRVSSAMVDYNRHLNNAYYAMFTEDWLGMKLDSPVRMTALQLNFNGSTGFGEELVCSGVIGENNVFCVSGTHAATGKNSFQAQGLLKRFRRKYDKKHEKIRFSGNLSRGLS